MRLRAVLCWAAKVRARVHELGMDMWSGRSCCWKCYSWMRLRAAFCWIARLLLFLSSARDLLSLPVHPIAHRTMRARAYTNRRMSPTVCDTSALCCCSLWCTGSSEDCNRALLQQLPKPLAARVELALESDAAVEFAAAAERLRQSTRGKGWAFLGT